MKNLLIIKRKLRCLPNYFVIIFFFITILIPHNIAFARMNTGQPVHPDEFSVLPRWCQIKILAHPRVFNTPPLLVGGPEAENVPDSVMKEYEKWSRIIGKDIFVFTHHYCMGLNRINRYKRSFIYQYKGIETDRGRALQGAIGSFKFMRGRLLPKHKLYYMMLMKEAYVYREMGNIKRAVKNYREIIKRKPKYAPVYVEYAEMLISVGNNSDAIKILQFGMEKTNGAEMIKNALNAMGEKKTN